MMDELRVGDVWRNITTGEKCIIGKVLGLGNFIFETHVIYREAGVSKSCPKIWFIKNYVRVTEEIKLEKPEVGEKWKHRVTGTVYTVTDVIRCDNGIGSQDSYVNYMTDRGPGWCSEIDFVTVCRNITDETEMKKPKVGEKWMWKNGRILEVMCIDERLNEPVICTSKSHVNNGYYQYSFAYDDFSNFTRVYDSDGDPVVNLEVGKMYRTAGGKKAFCCGSVSDFGRGMAYVRIEGHPEVSHYNLNGVSFTHIADFNIVGEWKDDD